MQDLKNLNCLLLKTKEILEKVVANCPFLDKFVLVEGSTLTLYLCYRKREVWQSSNQRFFSKKSIKIIR